MGAWCSDTLIVHSGSLKKLSIIVTPKIWALGALTLLFFLRVSNDWASSSTEIFGINMYFEYGLNADLFWMMTGGLSSREQILLECVFAVNVFNEWCQCIHSTSCNYMKRLEVLKKVQWCFQVAFCFVLPNLWYRPIP